MALSPGSDLPLIIITATIVFVIIAGGSILFFIAYHRRLLKQQEDYQRSMLDAIIETQENERQRISEDVHDDMGGLLSIIKMKFFETIKKTRDTTVTDELIDAGLLLDEAIKKARNISKELAPVTLKDFGLGIALEEFSTRKSNREILKININNELKNKLGYKTELAVYRVIQEAFSNSVKHGFATRVNVSLDIQEDHLKLDIRDNGWGFCMQEYKSTPTIAKGLGLRNIESRVASLSGKLNFNSEKGKGCKIEIELPLSS